MSYFDSKCHPYPFGKLSDRLVDGLILYGSQGIIKWATIQV